MDATAEQGSQAEPHLFINATCVVSFRSEGTCLERNNVVWPIGHPHLETLALLSLDEPPTAGEAKMQVVDQTGVAEVDMAAFIMDLVHSLPLSAGARQRHLPH